MKVAEHVLWHKRMRRTVYRFLLVLIVALVLTAIVYPGPVTSYDAKTFASFTNLHL